jgi:putative transposase
MSTKYKFKDQTKLYFVSFSVVYWIDLFVRNVYKDIMLKSWEYCQAEKGMELYAWCIMTSHIHLILGSHGDKLENIMRDMKRYTSGQLKTAIKDNPQESRREWILWLMEERVKRIVTTATSSYGNRITTR